MMPQFEESLTFFKLNRVFNGFKRGYHFIYFEVRRSANYPSLEWFCLPEKWLAYMTLDQVVWVQLKACAPLCAFFLFGFASQS